MPGEIAITSVSGIETEIARGGVGPPLLFLHSGDGPEFGSPFLRSLASSFDVVAPALPGFGRSEMPLDVKRVDDLAYFVLDLMKSLGLDDVTLVGVSFGAWVASEVAVRDTKRLRALALVSPVGARFSDDPAVSEISDIYMLADEETHALAFADARGRTPDVNALSDDELVALSRNRIALCQYAWSPYMHNPTLRRWLHRIDAPTLIVTGERDRLLAPRYAGEWAKRIVGAECATIAGAGHFPQVEQPDETARKIKDFSTLRAASG